MRISTSQIFSRSLTQMNSSLNDVTRLNQMNHSQKRINKPSDDPEGMGKVMELGAYNQTLSGYIDNCGTANDLLDQADRTLGIASEQIAGAMELAEQGANGTYTGEQLRVMAFEMESYRDSLLTVANAQAGSDSLFAGDDLQSDAYEMGTGVTLPNSSLTNADFVGHTGELERTVYIQFTEPGTIGTDEIDYRYSTDFGETWTTDTLAAGTTTIDTGGVQTEFVNGTAVTPADSNGGGTQFHLRETALYTGSDKAMSVAISENTSVDMTSVGSSIFGGVDSSTATPYPEPNLFETISDCIVYMEMGDHDAVAACLEDIAAGHEIVESGAANIGARENKVTYTKQSLSLVKTMTDNSISREEDADAAQLIVELEQANYVYEAVLNSSADIMRMSLLDHM